MTDLRALLRDLTAAPGISGSEDAAAALTADRLRAFTDAVTIDSLANVIARFGPADGPALAVCAHLDSIGFMVKHQPAPDVLRVVTVGGINLKAAPGTAVLIHAEGGSVNGIIGVRSQHQSGIVGDKLPDVPDLYVEIPPGLSIAPGTPITYAPQFIQLGERVAAPYLDDRAGVVSLIALAERLHANPPPLTVYLIATTQEETTCQGAKAALGRLRPDAALFVDGTVTYDTPETARFGAVMLGTGPVLNKFLYIRGLAAWHAHPPLFAHVERTARAAGLPYQMDAVHGLMADSLGAVDHGIPSAVIGLPMRGKHAPLELLDLADLTATIDLLAALCAAELPDLARG